jgi:hypothetical protein
MPDGMSAGLSSLAAGGAGLKLIELERQLLGGYGREPLRLCAEIISFSVCAIAQLLVLRVEGEHHLGQRNRISASGRIAMIRLPAPADDDHRFRLKATSRSDGWRPPFPIDGDHLFRRMATTCGGL